MNSKKKQNLKKSSGKKLQNPDFFERQELLIVKRHKFGLFTIYGLTILGIALVAISFSVLTDILSGFVVLILSLLFMLIIFKLIHKIYISNRLTISNLDIQQNVRTALFDVKFSTLNLIDVEDVTYTKNGIFATLLDYGVINIETAGEQSNFSFIYCPKPEKVRQTIFNARIAYIKNSGNSLID